MACGSTKYIPGCSMLAFQFLASLWSPWNDKVAHTNAEIVFPYIKAVQMKSVSTFTVFAPCSFSGSQRRLCLTIHGSTQSYCCFLMMVSKAYAESYYMLWVSALHYSARDQIMEVLDSGFSSCVHQPTIVGPSISMSVPQVQNLIRTEHSRIEVSES